MKYFLVGALLIANTAFAYHCSTSGNQPMREASVVKEKRHPASVQVKADGPEKAVKIQNKR